MVTLRKLKSSDTKRINELMKQLNTTYAKELSEEDVKKIISKNFHLGIFEDNKLVGCSHLIFFEIFMGMHGWIDGVIVDKECRGKGYGKRMMEEIIKYCKEHSVQYIVLCTDTTYTVANKMYESLGFQKTVLNHYAMEL